MFRKLGIIITGMMLVFSTPAQAGPAEEIDSIIEVCKIDLTEFRRGNKTWLEDQFKKNKTTEGVQLMIKTVCYAWGQGFIEGRRYGNVRTI